MTDSAAQLDRMSLTRRPAGPAIGYQTWSNLLFVHWRLPAARVEPLLPAGLTLDVWQGEAWVGLVPFYMSGVRPWWSPPVPGVSNFCETNVRTYVYDSAGRPGVWFFSLEASQSLAVRVGRGRWNLPYYRATMSLERNGGDIRYSCRRLWPGRPGPGCEIEATIGDPWLPGGEAGLSPGDRASAVNARAGTLEHFLVERYLLYTQTGSGQLRSGRVHHVPYPLRQIRIHRLEDSLLDALGLAPDGDFCHALFSEGVSVDIFPLQPV